MLPPQIPSSQQLFISFFPLPLLPTSPTPGANEGSSQNANAAVLFLRIALYPFAPYLSFPFPLFWLAGSIIATMPSGSDPPRHAFTEEEADEILLKKAIVDNFQMTPNWRTVVENGLLPAAVAEAVVDVWKATWEIRDRFPDDSSIDTLVVRACSQVYDIRFRAVPGYEKATDRISAMYPFLSARERNKMNSLLHKVVFTGGSAIPSKHTFGPTFKRQFQRLYCITLYALFSKESIKSSSMNLWILDNAQQLWFVPPTQVPEMRPLLAAHKASLVRPDASEGIRARAELVGAPALAPAPAHGPLPVAAPAAAPTTTPESSLAPVVRPDQDLFWLTPSEIAELNNAQVICLSKHIQTNQNIGLLLATTEEKHSLACDRASAFDCSITIPSLAKTSILMPLQIASAL